MTKAGKETLRSAVGLKRATREFLHHKGLDPDAPYNGKFGALTHEDVNRDAIAAAIAAYLSQPEQPALGTVEPIRREAMIVKIADELREHSAFKPEHVSLLVWATRIFDKVVSPDVVVVLQADNERLTKEVAELRKQLKLRH